MTSKRGLTCLLFGAALLPFCSMAQQPVAGLSTSQTQIMNARYIVLNDMHLVEFGPSKWFLGNPTYPYAEVKRTETELFLMPVGNRPATTPLVVDFAARLVYADFEKTKRWTSLVAAYPTSGYSVGRVDLSLQSRQDGGSARVSLDVNGASNKGWSLTSYKRDGSVMDTGPLPETGIARGIDVLSFTQGKDTITINPVSGTCRLNGWNCSVTGIAPVSGKEVGHIKYGKLTSDNTWVGLNGITQVSTSKWREETATGSVEWTEKARTPAYVDLQRSGNADATRFYMNIGGELQGAGASSDLRVAHVQRQWPGQLGTVFQQVAPGVSPGFQIQNKTDYPVLVTLEQIGCLYYGIVKPGEVFQRNTGAVWFTIKASMAPDLKEPTVESCIRKPAMYAATIAIAGASAGTLAVPAMIATAAGQGAAIATQQYVLANNGTATGAMGARVGVSTLMQGPLVVGLVFASGGSVPTAIASVVGSFWPNMAMSGAAVGATELYTRYTQLSDINSITGQLTQEASVTGAYAGYPWPWTMADRVMPRYEITGGPRIKTLADGSTILLTQERPLSIAKVN